MRHNFFNWPFAFVAAFLGSKVVSSPQVAGNAFGLIKVMEKTARKAHLSYLDGLRGLAALYVVFHHAYAYVQWDVRASMPPIVVTALDFFSYGRYSVDVFIVLSGFCLMLPVVRGDGTLGTSDAAFFRRRAWRIIPTYYLALLFSYALGAFLISQKTGNLYDLSLPVTGKSILPHLLMVHDLVNEDNTINYVFWSIAVEWRIYLLFPFLLLCWRAFGGVKTSAIAVLSSYALFLVCKRFDPEGLTAYYIGLFATGMLAANIGFSPSGDFISPSGESRSADYNQLQNWSWPRIATGLTGAVILFSMLKIGGGKTIPYYLQDSLVGFWTAALLVVLARSQREWLHDFLSQKMLVLVGTFSYSLYLIHAPLLQVLWQHVFTPWQEKPLPMFFALCFVGVPLSVAVSYVFFIVCERPFLRKR